MSSMATWGGQRGSEAAGCGRAAGSSPALLTCRSARRVLARLRYSSSSERCLAGTHGGNMMCTCKGQPQPCLPLPGTIPAHSASFTSNPPQRSCYCLVKDRSFHGNWHNSSQLQTKKISEVLKLHSMKGILPIKKIILSFLIAGRKGV